MALWTCPECRRRFGKAKQAHACQPGLTIEEYFSTGPERERPIFEVVRTHLESLGPVYIEPVQVGIFFKRSRTFVQLRPKTKWVALSFVLDRGVASPRMARKVVGDGKRWYHTVNLREPADVDAEVKGWLTESYASSPD